jgi:hypothetical protein
MESKFECAFNFGCNALVPTSHRQYVQSRIWAGNFFQLELCGVALNILELPTLDFRCYNMIDIPEDLRPAISKRIACYLLDFDCIFGPFLSDDMYLENVLATVIENSISSEKKINALEALSSCLESYQVANAMQ